MSEIQQRFGAMFRNARKSQGKTIKVISEATGYSVPYISDIERGVAEGSGKALDAIADALGMRITLVDANSGISPIIDKRTRYALKELSDSYRQFSRNGRWGTCGDCPRDEESRAYPEFCRHTDRYDHLLTAKALADAFERYKKLVKDRDNEQSMD